MLPPRYLLREAALFRLLSGDEPGTFVEIGCGGGELLVALARRGYTGVGTDISLNARAQSRKRLAEERIGACFRQRARRPEERGLHRGRRFQ